MESRVLEEPTKEANIGSLQRNIGEDSRFQNLVTEGGVSDMAGQLRALDRFQEQYPEDFRSYEESSIWYDNEGIPDIRQDLFYHRMEEHYEAQIDRRLTSFNSEVGDPNDILTSMAKSYSRVRFETAKEAVSEYKEQFPAKTKIYTDTGIRYNVHLANFDDYATERLSAMPENPDQLSVAFHKAIILNRLGNSAPAVDRNLVMKEIFDILNGGAGMYDEYQKSKKKFQEMWDTFIGWN